MQKISFNFRSPFVYFDCLFRWSFAIKFSFFSLTYFDKSKQYDFNFYSMFVPFLKYFLYQFFVPIFKSKKRE